MAKGEGRRIAVVGVGPVGGIMAAHLAGGGNDVLLVDILDGHLDAIERKGLRLSGARKMSVRFPAENICRGVPQLAGREPEIVFVSVKAHVLDRIVPELGKVVGDGTTFISLQNGLDTEEPIAEAFGRENTLRIVVNYGGVMIEDGHLRMTFFNPPNRIGAIADASRGRAAEVAAMVTAAGLETTASDDIKRDEWEKLILNLGLAAMCSLTNKSMKEMMEYTPTRDLARELMREGVDVARACGYGFHDGFLEECMAWLDGTGYHRPSMAMDILAGRRTEIAYLNGKVVERGAEKGVPTPYNSSLTWLVKGRELPRRETAEGS
ncbi:MAG: 2-dehydropantoate 2-reductase [Thermoplasmata archaeon]|nr:2-dehydropantoate 2-reductase [Thermoplasmata archaeon]